jgi:hypothetical protein
MRDDEVASEEDQGLSKVHGELIYRLCLVQFCFETHRTVRFRFETSFTVCYGSFRFETHFTHRFRFETQFAVRFRFETRFTVC